MLWVVGSSKSGKTLFSRALATRLGLGYVSASAWAREGCGVPESDPQFRKKISDYSREQLASCPFYSRECLQRAIRDVADSDDVIVDGSRNPTDFFSVFDPGEDSVVLIERPLPVDDFDTGVLVIAEGVRWMLKNAILRRDACFDEPVITPDTQLRYSLGWDRIWSRT